MTPEPVIRAPNHLGDVVMALPALADARGDVVVAASLAPLLAMAVPRGRVFPLVRGGRGFVRAARELRRRGYREGVLLTPSFSAAWLFRWGGVRRLRGTDTDARGPLLTDRVPTEALAGRHRILQYRLLLAQPHDPPATGHAIRPPEGEVAAWRGRIDGAGDAVVGLIPGSNAPARRWPADRFGKVARALEGRGARIVVMGGPAERALTALVAAAADHAVDAGGATDLPGLAALLSICDLVITNDTGPMHVAGAVGTPTLTLWGPSDSREVHPVGGGGARLTGLPLWCMPCRKNRCPRTGPGTILEDANGECMRLIEVKQVLDAAESILEGRAG